MTWFQRQLGDVNQTVDAAQVNEGAEVDDGEETVPLRRMPLTSLRGFRRARSAAFLEQHAAGQHDVVAVAIHLDDASFDFGAQVGVEIFHAARSTREAGRKPRRPMSRMRPPLATSDNLAGDGLAGLELLFDADPSALVLSTLLGEDQAAVPCLPSEEQRSLDFVAQGNDLEGSASLRMDSSRAG